MSSVAHVTHEAIYKSGGIGTVLEGLLTSEPYRAAGFRTILISPLFCPEGDPATRLGPGGEILYSSLDGVGRHPLAERLNEVRHQFQVDLVYGHRTLENPYTGVRACPEVVLIDVSRMSLEKTNVFKAGLWEAFGIDSTRYEHSYEYDLYVKLAPPALAALRAIGAAPFPGSCTIVAHEWMGVPTALATRFDSSDAFRTVFYAHETATVRPIIEHHPGHDVAFYNVMDEALRHNRYVDDVFGSQDHFYRHPLIKATASCDKILAVGDAVARELRFMSPQMAEADIKVCFNGIPAEMISLEDKRRSQTRMKDYAERLLGDRPDYIFTHVARNITSKGFWRDFRVLEHLEKVFRRQDKSAVLFVLSTEMPARSPDDIARMEEQWGWPIAHREGGHDLSYNEAIFHIGVQQFNTRARQIKAVFINQFGWGHGVCGKAMPPDMSLLDLRRGTDVEFGQSVYEPFGIAQLEPLTYGAICVMSSVCGCANLAMKMAGGRGVPNVIVADYCNIGPPRRTELEWLAMTRKERHQQEVRIASGVAHQLQELLPKDDLQTEALMESGYKLASQMSWDVIARKYVVPSLQELGRAWTQLHVA